MSSSKPSKTKFITRIVSFFSKRTLNKAPLESLKKVKIDAYLISIGLISNRFGVEGSVGQGFWKRSHQLIVLFLQWFMFIKWLFCYSMADNYMPAHMIGDFTAYLPGQQFDYHFLLILWSSIGAFSSSMFSMARHHHKLNLQWLRPFELCKGTVKHQDMKLGAEEASDFWQRVIFSLWISKAFIRILFLISVAGVVSVLVNHWPKDQLYSWGVVWTVITIIWLYYTISIQFGVMTVFHMLCYYFIAKFRRLNEMVTEMDTNRSELMAMHHKINTYMTDHNSFARELVIYNKFWQYYMAMNFMVYITIICFFIEVILLTKMVLFFKMIVLLAIFGFLVCLVFIAFSAGAVSDEIHESYGELNAVSQSNMPLVLKTQLQIYIARIGGPTMGFSCWDLFTVTYDGFFQALLMIGSFFLLFMDVTQSEKKKRNTVPNEVVDSPELTFN